MYGIGTWGSVGVRRVAVGSRVAVAKVPIEADDGAVGISRLIKEDRVGATALRRIHTEYLRANGESTMVVLQQEADELRFDGREHEVLRREVVAQGGGEHRGEVRVVRRLRGHLHFEITRRVGGAAEHAL